MAWWGKDRREIPIKKWLIFTCFLYLFALCPSVTYAEHPDTIPETIAQTAYWEGVDPALMTNIAYVESGFDPKAKNKDSTASGLFQILKGTWKANDCGDWSNRFDVYFNLRCAIRIAKGQGYAAWLASYELKGSGWRYLPYSNSGRNPG